MAMAHKIDDEFLLFWHEEGDREQTVREGAIYRPLISKIQMVHSTHESCVEVYYGTSVIHVAIGTREQCRDLLSWYYGKPFPPKEIGTIEDPIAYAKAYESWKMEK